MSTTASKLLQKVKEALQLRTSDFDQYKTFFNNPGSFITATIGGQQEFVPIALLCKNYERYQTLLDLFLVFGEPEPSELLNSRLHTFYEQHGLPWPSEKIQAVPPTYYVRPVPQQDSKPFFTINSIEKLSTYAGTSYKASDAFLKDLGATYAEEVVDKTNNWAQAIALPEGYQLEPERYWQVAGRFKAFTWAKIYAQKYKDKKIFFSVGVHVAEKKLVIKLDGLRSGTHKLSNFEIRNFDYFTQGQELEVVFDAEKIPGLSLEALAFVASRFITFTKAVYEQAIEFIWHDKVDVSLHKNRLFKMSNSYQSQVEATPARVEEEKLLELVQGYEQFMLIHAGREALAVQVEPVVHGNLQLLRSFEVDGKPRNILLKATTGGTQTPFEMSREEIEYLGDNMHTWLYHIVEYNPDTHSAKLVVRKGSPTKYAHLKSIRFEVTID